MTDFTWPCVSRGTTAARRRNRRLAVERGSYRWLLRLWHGCRWGERRDGEDLGGRLGLRSLSNHINVDS